MKKFLKVIGIIIVTLLICAILFVGYLTVIDYQPDPVEEMVIKNIESKPQSQELSVVTWNIGYAGLGENEDFFFDGGETVRPSEEVIDKNMAGILKTIQSLDADYYLLQEIDRDSKRSYYKDEFVMIENVLKDYSNTFAYNYKVDYVPYPIPPMGRMRSGVGVFANTQMQEANRYAFSENYSWPYRVGQLDRCFLETRYDVEGTDKDLIVINAHLSAYDNGTLRTSQLKELKAYMYDAYEKGHYVIVGGDFNQVFEVIDNEQYPVLYPDVYLPSSIPADWLDESWQFGIDGDVPTYRLLNKPYTEAYYDVVQIGVIDGFVVSPNVEITSVETLDEEFKYSDHNPVLMNVELLSQ